MPPPPQSRAARASDQPEPATDAASHPAADRATDPATNIEADGLLSFVDASPSPFHACAQVAAWLDAAGFTELDETADWAANQAGKTGRRYVRRGGSLVAWSTDVSAGPTTPFRIVGAHTDSPNLRVKPRPDLSRAGFQLLGVEPYGGLLLNSWLDRDLGLSGRVVVRDGSGVDERLLHLDEPLLRVPQLAIHLDRELHEKGLQLNKQWHLTPVWGVGDGPADFPDFLATELGVAVEDVLAWDLMTHDLAPSRRLGRDRDLISAPRLDNLGTSYAGARALLRAVDEDAGVVPVLVLFDHEEVGSVSERGAMSTMLPDVLERVVAAQDGDRTDFMRALAGSVCASGDMAHATHPNYPDRHEPQHQIALNGGPVLKINTNLRYATDARGAAAFQLACAKADVPVQTFVTRSDLPCGSTVGPVTAARLGITTVDFGQPMLAMHSAREMCGAYDPVMYVAALAAFLAPSGPR